MEILDDSLKWFATLAWSVLPLTLNEVDSGLIWKGPTRYTIHITQIKVKERVHQWTTLQRWPGSPAAISLMNIG